MIKFLEENSGQIIGVGDIFDHSRSEIVGESREDYLERTIDYWKHFDTFLIGNHDADLIKDVFVFWKTGEYFTEQGVLAFHGHQLQLNFNESIINRYEKKFAGEAKFSLFWEIEEKLLEYFNRFFKHNEKSAKKRALKILEKLEEAGMLEDFHTIIVGHDHLPFDVNVNYNGFEYRVANCGSACHGQESRPVYVDHIGKWFVSDLHLGTKKCNI